MSASRPSASPFPAGRRRRSRVAALAALAIAGSLSCAELASRLWLLAVGPPLGTLLAQRQGVAAGDATAGVPGVVAAGGARPAAMPADDTEPAEGAVLHPYLGKVLDPGAPQAVLRGHLAGWRVSAQGFLEPDSTEAAPTAGAGEPPFVVGVFGGSVALGFSIEARNALVQELRRLPALATRPIRVESRALAAYKQPQQLMALAWCASRGEHFDAVINLDGFNDLVLPVLANRPAGINPFYPAQWRDLVADVSEPATARRIGELAFWRSRRTVWARASARAPWSSSAALALAWRAGDRGLERRMARLGNEPLAGARRGDFLRSGPASAEQTNAEVFDAAAELWGRSSRLMSALVAADGGRYYHFLQPNQYVPDSKPMRAAERARAVRDRSRYGRSVGRGWDKLRRAGAELRASGVRFLDLSMVFAEVEEPVYVDSCCHLNALGNRLLAERIGRAVVDDLGRAPLADPSAPTNRIGR